MAGQITLIQLEQHRASESSVEPAIPMERLKLRRPDRRQVTCRAVEIEQLAGADHPARAIWELSGRLDLSGFAGALRTQRDQGGRAAWDPRLLAAVWIWAYSEGISSAREIERQMQYRPELEWLCGMDVISHHTLSDFRVCQAEALEQIFTQVLAEFPNAWLKERMGGAQVSSARVEEGASGAVVGATGIRHSAVDSAGVEARGKGGRGGLEADEGARAAAKRPQPSPWGAPAERPSPPRPHSAPMPPQAPPSNTIAPITTPGDFSQPLRGAARSCEFAGQLARPAGGGFDGGR